jgi:hypothetical protein
MARWSAFLWLAVTCLGLTAGCSNYGDICPDCSPDEPVEQVQEKVCDLETHVCVPRVGGGWDGVLQWKGHKKQAPEQCPEAATNISFWGEEVLPPNMPPGIPAQTVVGCGFIEDGICESEPDLLGGTWDETHFICAPHLEDWHACIVANSTRGCPPAYAAQTIVGSDTAGDLEWTVCCLGAAVEGPESPPKKYEEVEGHPDKVMSPPDGIEVRALLPGG